MQIFVSWSGSEALAVARELHEFLPAVVQEASPWVSDKDIEAGSVWREEIRRALEGCAYSIICVTPASLRSPWVHFEAGAIAEGFKKPVCPYLIGVDPTALSSLPIANLQWVTATKEGTEKLVTAINNRAERKLTAKVLARAVAGQWPSLEKVIAGNTIEAPSADPREEVPAVPFPIEDGDAANVVTAWLRGISVEEERELVQFVVLDKRFGFPPGTTRRVFQRAATEAGYRVEGATEKTALLQRDLGGFVVSDRPRGWSPNRDGFGGF
jgi:hypothetical protein